MDCNKEKDAISPSGSQADVPLDVLALHSTNLLTVLDEDGVVQYASPSIECMLGYEHDELVGEQVTEYFHPDDREKVITAFQAVFTGKEGNVETVEYRHKQTDGTYIWVESVASANPTPDGHYVVNTRDISDRKQREQELERYESIVENTEDGIYMFDEHGRFEFVNQRVIDISGISRDAWVGEHVSIQTDLGTLSDSEVTAIETGIEAIFNGDESEVRIELMPDVPSDLRVLELRLTSYQTTNGDSRVIGFSRDITDQKEYEQKLERQNERLDEFAGVVSHDLRNPLSIAIGRLELIADEYESDHIQVIERSHQRMKSLIDELLTLAREGDQVSDTEVIDLGVLALECWKHIETGDATIVTDTDGRIQADTSRLQQLLENLMQNAIEHGDGDVTITIGMLDDGFYVEDDGSGIPSEDWKQVFETGYSTAQEGTGFGLSIVKRVVEAHEWDIRVSDSIDGGARFEITGVNLIQ
jgi:PAS domain S-box-containing protein